MARPLTGDAAVRSEVVWPEAAFHALFQLHYARVVGFVAQMLGERGRAEEIADDAFWKLYQRPKLSQDGENPAGWIYRVASRMALDALRSRRRQRGHQASFEAEAVLLPSSSPNPLAALVQSERALQVRAALRCIKPLHAQALLLRHSGLSYLELAAALEIKSNSVGTTLARAERAFEREFAKENA